MSYFSMTLPNGQTVTAPQGIPHPGGNALGYVSVVLCNAQTYLLILATFLALIVIIWSGFQWITSDGDKEKIEAARKRMSWAIVGLVLVLLTFLIVLIIGNFFGVTLFSWCGT